MCKIIWIKHLPCDMISMRGWIGGKYLEIQNALANRIDTAGEMISYDEACKRVLANKIILAWILKSCVREYYDYEIEEIADKYIEGEPEVSASAVNVDEVAEFVTGMNAEDTTIKEGKTLFDIKFRAILPYLDEIVDMIVNVEAQNDFYPGYPIVKRGVYYASRMISSQYGTVFTDSDYQKIKKVYSIWICPNPPEYRKNTIASYSIQENNIIGITNEKEINYDLLTVVMVCLGGKDKENYDGVLKMLDVLLSGDTAPADKKRTLQEEFGIAMTKKLEGDVMGMCNLSKGVYDKAVIKDLRNLMDSTGWDVDKCMDMLKVPENSRTMYKDMILEKPVSA